MVRSAYIHIPFCSSLCSYCDFCKMFYSDSLAESYLDKLQQEIMDNYQGEKLKTIYIGGGTPSCLNVNQLKKLLTILSTLKREEDYEYTIELNVENTTFEKLKLCYLFGINRLSFGLETSNENLLKELNRHHSKDQITSVISMAKDIGFTNINVDLMYGLPNETLQDVKKDLEFIDSLQVNHISTYSLILEEHTKFYIEGIKQIDEELDFRMYQTICEHLKQKGFKHYELSNYALKNSESRHNLTYWDNEEYYGFGLGASGYLNHVRYNNTKSINHYLKGMIKKDEEYLTTKDEMSYEMILGLRKLKGVSKTKFFNKFHKNISDVFNYQKYLDASYLIEEDDNLKIAEDKIYVSNEILVEFVGSEENE